MITSLEIQKRNKNKVNLYIDGEYRCALTAESVVSARLKIGQELTEGQLKDILEGSETQIAFDKSLNYISRSMKTIKQVADYLKRKGFEESVIVKAIDKLKNYKYVDDELYASMYVESQKGSKGEIRLKQELLLKGVDKEIIQTKLSNLDQQDSLLAAKKTAQKFIKNKQQDEKLKLKLYRHLLSRGFDYETVNSVANLLDSGMLTE